MLERPRSRPILADNVEYGVLDRTLFSDAGGQNDSAQMVCRLPGITGDVLIRIAVRVDHAVPRQSYGRVVVLDPPRGSEALLLTYGKAFTKDDQPEEIAEELYRRASTILVGRP